MCPLTQGHADRYRVRQEDQDLDRQGRPDADLPGAQQLAAERRYAAHIESGDKGKGKQNSDYSISIVANEIFPAATNNNDLANATSVNFGNVNTIDLDNEWIGYGDDTDFFRFELDSASRVDFDLNLDNKA